MGAKAIVRSGEAAGEVMTPAPRLPPVIPACGEREIAGAPTARAAERRDARPGEVVQVPALSYVGAIALAHRTNLSTLHDTHRRFLILHGKILAGFFLSLIHI